MAKQGQVVHGDDERHSRAARSAERRAVEQVEAAHGPAERERVPPRVAGDGRGATRAAEGEALELEPGPALECADETADVTGRAGRRLHERGNVDADPHAVPPIAACAARTASRGSA